MTTTYEDIQFDAGGGVARITINRPERYNALRDLTIIELTQAFKRVGQDRSIGVTVLTGSGEKAFCAGGDVNWEAEGGLENRHAENLMKNLYAAMRDSLKPCIARVNGYAIGGGNHLAYFCDFTVAADHAIFGQNGPRVGSPAQGSLVAYLVRVVGAKRAREMWMLCRRYSAAQAAEWGLVNSVVPMSQLDAEIQQWCDELLSLSPTVLKLLKRTFDDEYAPMRQFFEDLDYLPEINPGFFASGEQEEGAQAFLEKRQADFSSWR
jgi:dihydroxynaphthoic acid synthetase